ncbi:hypothetical protein D3C85_1430260 [compost metagenome]
MADQGRVLQTALGDIAPDLRCGRSADQTFAIAARRHVAEAAHGDQVHPIASLQRAGRPRPHRRGRGQPGDQDDVRPLSPRLDDDAVGLKGRRTGGQSERRAPDQDQKAQKNARHGTNLVPDRGEESAQSPS